LEISTASDSELSMGCADHCVGERGTSVPRWVNGGSGCATEVVYPLKSDLGDRKQSTQSGGRITDRRRTPVALRPYHHARDIMLKGVRPVFKTSRPNFYDCEQQFFQAIRRSLREQLYRMIQRAAKNAATRRRTCRNVAKNIHNPGMTVQARR